MTAAEAADTMTVVASVSHAPSVSVTSSLIAYTPGRVKRCVACTPVAVPSDLETIVESAFVRPGNRDV